MSADTVRIAVIFGVIKGAIMSTVLATLDVSTWNQILVAAVSATLTSVGVIVAAIIQGRSERRTRDELQQAREELKHVKRAVGASRRATDRTE